MRVGYYNDRDAALEAAGLSAPGIASAGSLDQQQTDVSSGYGVGSGQSLAQTFTAGITGSFDRIDVALEKNGAPTAPLIVEIRNVIPGSIGTTVLGSSSVPASALLGATPTWVEIPFTASIPVSAGSSYAIVVYTSSVFPDTYSWDNSPTDVYAGGTVLLTTSSPPNNTWTPAVDDQAFRTYVDPTSPDTTPPDLSLSGKRKQRLGKPVKVKVACDEACSIVAKGKVTPEGAKSLPETLKLRPARTELAAGELKTLELKLSKKAARKLTHGAERAVARISVKATDAAGNEARATRKTMLS